MDYSEKVVQWLENLGNLALEEVPSFVQEIATYGFYSSVVDSFAFLFAFLSCLVAFFYLKKQLEIGEKSEDACVIGLFFSLVGSLLFFVLLFVSIEVAIKALVCPKLYVI